MEHGIVHRLSPVVSGMLRVVAPASMTAASTLYRNLGSERPASSGLNSMSWQPRLRRCLTALTAFSTTCHQAALNILTFQVPSSKPSTP